MTIRSLGKSRCAACVVLSAFVVFTAAGALGAISPERARESGSLSGFIFSKNGKTPVTGAVVRIRNVADMKEMSSAPADTNGMYTIAGIPEGRYIFGGELGERGLQSRLRPLCQGRGAGQALDRARRGRGRTGAGEASVKKTGFFNTVAGRVLVVSAIGVGLYFLIAEPESSPESR